MKKHIKLTLIAVLAISFFSFTMLKEKQVNIETSTINWLGKKVTGSHNGTIKLKSGALNFEADELVGGNFVVDMTSISVADLSGRGKMKLESHLKSADFFDVNQHKTANFKITKATKQYTDYEVTGLMTIKNITKPVSFNMVVNDNSASATFKIDRTDFNVKYKSDKFFDNLKDKAINDDFELEINLKY